MMTTPNKRATSPSSDNENPTESALIMPYHLSSDTTSPLKCNLEDIIFFLLDFSVVRASFSTGLFTLIREDEAG